MIGCNRVFDKGGAMHAREKYDRILEIEERLRELGAEEWLVPKLARRVNNIFPDCPLLVINDFYQRNWSMSDLFHWLAHAPKFKERDIYWMHDYIQIFAIEQLLKTCGLSAKTAHSLVLTQAWMFQANMATLELSVTTFVNLGYDEDVIKSIANKMPYLFFLLPEHILHECKEASKKQLGLLWNANLRDYEPPIPRPIPVVHSPNPPKPAPKKVVAAKQPHAQAVTNEAQEVQPDMAPASEPEPPKPAREMTELPRTLKPLRLFNPLKDNENAAKAALPDSPVVPTEEQEEEPNSGEWFLPPGSVAPVEPRVARATEDDGSRLHIEKIKALVKVASADDIEDAWQTFLAANPWLRQSSTVEYKACVVLLRWISLQPPGAVGGSYGESDAGLRFRFWKKVLLDDRYRGILRIFPNILERRLYVLRRIGRCPMKGPSWIMRPWETLEDAELRYRMNEIDAHGKKPNLKPYINMLLEPTRDKFKRRLHRYLESKVVKDEIGTDSFEDGLIMDDEPVKYITREELKQRLLEARNKK
ncbi:hypothetical protein GF391_04160 [Candidatus Uhrbacteria bacterium]|nr:hypothetical protein [Candidatus Uhrbacteria bacterium]